MKLLLAVDLREHSETVFEQAVRWAVRLEATLDALYVGIYDDIYEFVSDPKLHALLENEAEKARQTDTIHLETLLTTLPERLRGRALVASGSPAEVIVAAEESYDALMVATHGRKGVAKLWLGSVAERVVRATERPVIVLHVPR